MWKYIDKFGLFLIRFYRAIKFAVYDYDAKLKQTKTNTQRRNTWIGVVFITLLGIGVFLLTIRYFINSLILNHN